MSSLENAYHDFPRLAKQSGFHFQLHRGKVNWSEIENLDLNDIIKNENYKLLENNLANVINCDLEKEYDIEILDQNFVKLFKLAQLGVDYLSYFEIYLDKCVILLQEQLIAFKEEFYSFKRKDLNNSKKKSKVQSYKCEKCEKVFISDVYLKFHEKRRHNRPNNLEKLHQKYPENEEKKHFSVSTQTILFKEASTLTQGPKDMNSLFKIEKLEQELEELRENFKKAKISLKTEGSKADEFTSLKDEKKHNSILLFLPFYMSQLNNGFEKTIPEVAQPDCTTSPLVESKTSINNPAAENFSELNFDFKNKFNEENKRTKEKTELSSITESGESLRKILTKGTTTVRCENDIAYTNRKKDLFTNESKPLPPPRKLKKGLQRHLTESEMGLGETDEDAIYSDNRNSESNLSVEAKSTLLKKANENILNIFEDSKESPKKLNKLKSNSFESFEGEKSFLVKPQFKSPIEKIVKSSPNFRKINENFKKSFKSRLDSLSAIKKKQSDSVSLKKVRVDEINIHLKQLGVDPEWTGIPKKTMKQKLNVLKHRRRLLCKANPMYSVVRQNVEKKIIKKLKTSRENKKIFGKKISEQTRVNIKSHPSQITSADVSDVISIKNCAINNIDTEADSAFSGREQNYSDVQKNVITEETGSSSEPKGKIQIIKNTELDFSMFQIGKSLRIITDDRKNLLSDRTTDCTSDADIESDFFDNFNGKSSKIATLNSNYQKKKGK